MIRILFKIFLFEISIIFLGSIPIKFNFLLTCLLDNFCIKVPVDDPISTVYEFSLDNNQKDLVLFHDLLYSQELI